MSSAPAAIDEYPIKQIPRIPLWSENFALAAVDSVKKASVFYSIGRWHADTSVWRENIVIAMPGGRIIFARNYGRNASPTGPGASFSRYEVLRPEHRLQLTYSGPIWESTLERLLDSGAPEFPAGNCSLDLMFEATMPLWNMQGDSTEASSMAGGLHIEQIGEANGTLVYQGEKLLFDHCYAVRDHSRGVRDPSAFKRHCWINGEFPGKRSFFMYAMQFQGSDAIGMANAVIAQDGVFHPAKLVHTEFISGDGDMRKLHKVVLESALGPMEVKIAEVLTSIPVSFVKPFDAAPGSIKGRSSVVMFDEGVRLEWDGTQGIGWSERGVAIKPL